MDQEKIGTLLKVRKHPPWQRTVGRESAAHLAASVIPEPIPYPKRRHERKHKENSYSPQRHREKERKISLYSLCPLCLCGEMKVRCSR